MMSPLLTYPPEVLMDGFQQSRSTSNLSPYEPENDAGQWSLEDEVPLGCECANPALQIERWPQEAPTGLHEPY
jgi:hypothetical protein